MLKDTKMSNLTNAKTWCIIMVVYIIYQKWLLAGSTEDACKGVLFHYARIVIQPKCLGIFDGRTDHAYRGLLRHRFGYHHF